MVTYAKRPAQSDRLAHPVQKRQRTLTAPSIGPVSKGDVRIDTTLTPSGAMVPTIRLSRAEQSSGSAGKSSDKHAVIKTSAVAASGTPNITPSQVASAHGAALSSAESNGQASNTINIHRPRLSAFGGSWRPNWSNIGWLAVLLSATVLTVWAVYFLVEAGSWAWSWVVMAVSS